MKNRYETIKILGQGAFGRVELAKDLAQGNLVAVKYLLGQDEEEIDRFRRELRLLKTQLNNIHVVDVLDSDLDHKPPFIVLEYCEHGSLRKWVGKALPWPTIAEALANIISGLHGIHKLGGFHRDIKPDNVLIFKEPSTEKMLMKLTDFGLARVPVSTNEPMTYNAMGTYGYIAPEVMSGEDFSQSADIFSVGMVGIELLSGKRSSASLDTLPPEVPKAMKSLLRSMVSMVPGRRPEIGSIATSLRDLLDPAGVQKETVQSAVSKYRATIEQNKAVPDFRMPESDSNDGLWKLLLGGLAVFGLASLAKGDEEAWDHNVQRYRGSDGKFRRG